MKKLIVIFILLILAINICSQIDIRDDQEIIVVTKKGHVHWLWLLTTFLATLFGTAFAFGLTCSAKVGHLDGIIDNLNWELDQKDNALNESKRCLEKIQKEKANE